jgi:phospholipid/cholesterol/gamma-HCH transport system substrate-binding protein
LHAGASVKGMDPTRIDLFLAKPYELLDTSGSGIKNNRQLLSSIVTNIASVLDGLINDNKERVDSLVANLEEMTREAAQLTHGARVNYGDSPSSFARWTTSTS